MEEFKKEQSGSEDDDFSHGAPAFPNFFNNMFGKKTKREYYDMVVANFAKINPQPLSDELKRTWTIGRRNARLWAKKHGCDMNGRLRSDIAHEQRNNDALETALRAEDVAVDTQQRLEYLIERVRK